MDGPVILKGTCAMMIGDVARTIRDFFPEVVKFGVEVCSNLGTPEKYSYHPSACNLHECHQAGLIWKSLWLDLKFIQFINVRNAGEHR